MAKSSSKQRTRASAQSGSKTARPAKSAARRAATGRAKTSKTSNTASSRGTKRPKTAPKTAARAKVTANASAPKRRPVSSTAKPKGRKVTKPVAVAKKRAAARTNTPRPRTDTAKQRVAPKAAAQAAKKPLSPERPPLTPSIPSSLAYDTSATAARSGAEEIRSNRAKHTDTSPALTGGDIDASWEEASSTGDEAPGGDNLTPDQDVVEEIGSALGIEYADDEELQGGVELENRDRHRWEYDPASADDYIDRLKNES
jgi:hypothetical protein